MEKHATVGRPMGGSKHSAETLATLKSMLESGVSPSEAARTLNMGIPNVRYYRAKWAGSNPSANIANSLISALDREILSLESTIRESRVRLAEVKQKRAKVARALGIADESTSTETETEVTSEVAG